MWKRHAYYFAKPFLPWSLRMAVRRWRAQRQMRKFANSWPISPTSGRPPEGWPGWPGGKKFSFVLTHDVEGRKGLERCRQLMALESKWGFCSSFNFIPEGEYTTPKELRDFVTANGFEVGVHDLRHDGKLYLTRSVFRENAERINRYLGEWNAAGFRAGFMLHQLDWMHDLKIRYDASTFDTDPFEPQPDGVNTIFPFWIPDKNGSGYMELPYTLVQDFTLFVLLKEQNIEIWKRKLDWIVSQGGMVLLNTHPDYMNWTENRNPKGEFQVRLYEEFLRYVAERYAGQYWGALPHQVAEYCVSFRPRIPRCARTRVCMVAHSHYEYDNRIIRYAETLVERGDEVDVIALRSENARSKHDVIRGVNLSRVQLRLGNEKSKWVYLTQLIRFNLVSSIVLMRRHLKNRYDVIHVHNVPDFLVFAAWFPKLTGARVILDIHDLVPELYTCKFKSKTGGLGYKWLLLVEKLSTRLADHVIISNHIWFDRLVSRSVSKDKCSVMINNVDRKLFYPRKRTRNNGKVVILFHGTFQWHQGLDIAIRAFSLLQQDVPEAELHLYGRGDQKSNLITLTNELKVNEKVFFHDSVKLDEIPEIIANADLGVVPKRADSFGNEAYSTKIMEFMSQGVPAVISRTKIDSFYFNDGLVQFFEPGNEKDLADAMRRIIRDGTLRASLARNASEFVDRNNWDTKQDEYLQLVDRLNLCRET